MTNHNLKCWLEPFEEIVQGKKRFEYRFNDRNYKVGDLLILCEWDPKKEDYTGRVLRKRVVSILKEGFGLAKGYCVMSIGEESEL